MATIKVSQLTEKTVLADADLFPIVDKAQGSSKKVEYSTIKNDIKSGLSLPMKVYANSITQDAEQEPALVKELYNTLGGVVTVYREGPGRYTLHSDGLFVRGMIPFIESPTITTLDDPAKIVMFKWTYDSTSDIKLDCINITTGGHVDIHSDVPIFFKLELYE